MGYLQDFPDSKGYFGEFGGAYLPPELEKEFEKIKEAYLYIRNDHNYIAQLRKIRKHFQGRPTPVYYAANLSQMYGGNIYFKREDLNHTGAHKLNHCMAEVLLAKHMNKKKVIAETGAGQHGVALATAAAYFGLECEIHMGEVDIKKEKPNVVRMKLLGATIVPVSFGAQTLKEAVDSAFESYLKDPETSIYAIGSVVGPHPFPLMIRDFQSIVGLEAKEQFQDMTGNLPDNVVACVGGGSNALGIFSAFIDDKDVKLHSVEPMGKGQKIGEHAASLRYGSKGVMHGFHSIMLKDTQGEPSAVYSVASGLDYPSVGPEHAYLNTIGRTIAGHADDAASLKAFFTLSQKEGIIPALESAHAVAYACELASKNPDESILVNLSGRGDKDIDFITENYGFGEELFK
ncbi:MAG: tryptophan synthase subunit beta [Campylobacterota bacterium]